MIALEVIRHIDFDFDVFHVCNGRSVEVCFPLEPAIDVAADEIEDSLERRNDSLLNVVLRVEA